MPLLSLVLPEIQVSTCINRQSEELMNWEWGCEAAHALEVKGVPNPGFLCVHVVNHLDSWIREGFAREGSRTNLPMGCASYIESFLKTIYTIYAPKCCHLADHF